MVSKKKGGDGKTKSQHGRTRSPSKSEREYYERIHAAEQSTKRQAAWAKVSGNLIVVGGAVAVSLTTDKINAPGGAPWWCWLVMGVTGTAAIGLGFLYWNEMKRNGTLIERFAPYVKAVEESEDPHRSSSQLSTRGETKEEDK